MTHPSKPPGTPTIRRFAAAFVSSAIVFAGLIALGATRGDPGLRRAAASRPLAMPDLVVAAEVAGPVAPGAWARLSWTVRNAGDAAAPASALTVSWPSALLLQGASGGAVGLPGGDGVVWDLGTLAAGAERSLTTTLQVPPVQPVPSSLPVAGHALSAGEDGGGSDNLTVRDLLIRASDLRVAVSGPSFETAPGTEITHTVQVFNVGQGSAEGLRLDILLGAGLSYRRDTADAVGLRRDPLVGGVRLTRTAAPGPWTGTFDLVSRVPLTATSGMELASPLRLALSATSVDANPGNNSVNAAALAVVQPDLRAKITGPAELQPDDGAEYVFDYDNIGTGVARRLIMTATLPAGMRFASASPPGRQVSDRVWTWARTQLNVGDRDTVRAQVRLDGTLPAGARPSLGVVIGGSAVDRDVANNQAAAASLILPGPPATLSLSPSPAEIPVDDGTSEVTATVRDAFGNPVSDGTVVSFNGIGGDVVPGTVPTAGGMASTTFKAGNLAGPAAVKASAGAAAVQVPLTLAPAALNLGGAVQLAPGATEAQPGDRVAYDLTVRNLGLARAREPVLVVVLEQRLEVIEALIDGAPLEALDAVPAGVLDPPPAAYRQRAWRVPDLPSGATRAIKITVAIDGDPGLPWTGFDTVFFRAGLQSVTAEANGADQRHQQRLDVVAADMYTGISLNSLISSIRPGGLLVYQVTYGNAGQGSVGRGTLTATLPEGTHFESWEPTHGTPLLQRAGSFTVGSRELVWDFETPLARTSGLLLRLSVDAEAAPERLLQTAVILGAPRYDSNPDNDAAIDAGAWLSGVNLVVTPSGPDTAGPDESLSWQIDLRNLAQRDNAGNVVMKAILPAGFPVLETTPNGAILPDGSVRWVVDGAMGPGAATHFELRTRVPAALPAGSRVRLFVEVSSSSRDSYAADNKRELELRIVPGQPSQLRLTPSSMAPQACGGRPITLTAAVFDAFGNQVADGTPLRWQTADGDLTPSGGVTAAGVVSTTLSALRRSGKLRVGAASGPAEAALDLDVQPGPAKRISLAAAPSILSVLARTRLTGGLADDCGNPARDGTLLSFTASRGSFVGGTGIDLPTTQGRAVVDLDVGAEAGSLTVGVRQGDLVATTVVSVFAMTPTPTPEPSRALYLPRLVSAPSR